MKHDETMQGHGVAEGRGAVRGKTTRFSTLYKAF